MTGLPWACPSVQVAVGRREFLSVFGNDYKTDDGTGASWDGCNFGFPNLWLHPGLCPHPLRPPRSQGLHPRRGSGQGPHRCSEEAQGKLWLQGTNLGLLPALGGLPVGAEGGPGPSPLDPCPLSSSQIYNLGTGTGYSVLQMVRAMEKASGREVRADLQGHGHSCSHRPPDAPTAALAPFPQPLWEPPEPTVLLSLQIKYRITARREGDVASCYADPALAERELGWKAAFGLDKMCKGIPSLARRALPGPCPPSSPLSLFQVRTCGGGSCRTPRASARTEPWPRAGRARGLL